MIKITVKTEDFEGRIIEEECHFHLNKTELTELDLKYKGGLKGEIERLQKEKNVEELFQFVKELMILGYGIKTENGKAFIKRPEITEEFRYGYVLPECLVEIMDDETGAGVMKFIKGMMPVSTQQAIDEAAKKDPVLSKFYK